MKHMLMEINTRIARYRQYKKNRKLNDQTVIPELKKAADALKALKGTHTKSVGYKLIRADYYALKEPEVKEALSDFDCFLRADRAMLKSIRSHLRRVSARAALAQSAEEEK